ncbi:amidase domain-containing protein [Glutamicibacter mishrai]|uniref:amidase domain-containing protein n=1 Tax=Glutamicibacter mishrai TaxID=1775880 RepID=UPI0032EF9491
MKVSLKACLTALALASLVSANLAPASAAQPISTATNEASATPVAISETTMASLDPAFTGYADAQEAVINHPKLGVPALAKIEVGEKATKTQSLSTAKSNLDSILPTLDPPAKGGFKPTVEVVPLEVLSASGDTQKVLANVTTTISSAPLDDGTSEPSSWSDKHILTLSKISNTWVVTGDEYTSEEEAPVDYGDVLPDEKAAPTDRSSATKMIIASPALSPSSPAATKYPTQTKINASRFSAYALEHTRGKFNKDGKEYKNSPYPSYGNNCSNFASQVLDYAGWYTTGGNSLQVKSLDKWTYNLSGFKGATRTWSQARSLFTFAKNTGTYAKMGNIWNARTGDLLFTDWDPNKKHDGLIDHVMVVSGRSSGTPKISQKSPNRSNVSLNTTIALIKKQGRSTVWYGLSHK